MALKAKIISNLHYVTRDSFKRKAFIFFDKRVFFIDRSYLGQRVGYYSDKWRIFNLVLIFEEFFSFGLERGFLEQYFMKKNENIAIGSNSLNSNILSKNCAKHKLSIFCLHLRLLSFPLLAFASTSSVPHRFLKLSIKSAIVNSQGFAYTHILLFLIDFARFFDSRSQRNHLKNYIKNQFCAIIWLVFQEIQLKINNFTSALSSILKSNFVNRLIVFIFICAKNWLGTLHLYVCSNNKEFSNDQITKVFYLLFKANEAFSLSAANRLCGCINCIFCRIRIFFFLIALKFIRLLKANLVLNTSILANFRSSNGWTNGHSRIFAIFLSFYLGETTQIKKNLFQEKALNNQVTLMITY
ncbi:hypothetical protein BpHYR1_011974 [Brachionus plicatilis]|uniref:Uncharacterized protein n=1 Tax=Brachionus plicatilis TaxID=10195 RepID=A0A3M7S025_BRAPC|nr:hypothetical protein BpHYR1_011974 [Brachionus plicatilis]